MADSRNKLNEDFGINRLLHILKDNSKMSSQIICDKILASIREFSEEGNQFDDMTLVIVKSVS